jgi:hypothetical protein
MVGGWGRRRRHDGGFSIEAAWVAPSLEEGFGRWWQAREGDTRKTMKTTRWRCPKQGLSRCQN